MNEIKIIENNGVQVVSSREVAQNFGKRHDKLTAEIKRMYGKYAQLQGMPKMVDTPLFIESEYVHEQNRQTYTEFLMTRDGFSLLVMGFTGEEALEWKLKYIEAFNKMEAMIANQYANLSTEMKAIFMLDVKQQEMMTRIEVLETTKTIDFGQQRELQKLVGQRVYELLRSVKSEKLKNKLFAAIYKELKDKFSINSYRNIAVKDYEVATKVVKAWKPNEMLALAIECANEQMELF